SGAFSDELPGAESAKLHSAAVPGALRLAADPLTIPCLKRSTNRVTPASDCLPHPVKLTRAHAINADPNALRSIGRPPAFEFGLLVYSGPVFIPTRSVGIPAYTSERSSPRSARAAVVKSTPSMRKAAALLFAFPVLITAQRRGATATAPQSAPQ